MHWVLNLGALLYWAAVVSDGQDGPTTNPVLKTVGALKVPTTTPLVGEPNVVSSDPSETEKVIKSWVEFQRMASSGVDSIVRRALPLVTRAGTEVDISPQCMNGVLKFLVGVRGLKSWAIRMLDASGRLPPGLLDGSISDLGNFDQCLEIRLRDDYEDKEVFRGQHCAVNLVPLLPPKEFQVTFRSLPVDLSNVTEKDSVFMDFSKKAPFFYRILIRIGVCVPSVCSTQDLNQILQFALKDTMFNGSVPFCQKDEEWDFNYIQIGVMASLGVILALCGIGTWVDGSWPKDAKEDTSKDWLAWFLEFFRCFSLPKNMESLMSTNSGGDKLSAMDGIRVLSMFWIILVHSYAFQHHNSIGKIMEIINFAGNISFSVIVNAWISVDSFFFLGGVLVAYSTLKTIERNDGKLHFVRYVLRRIWRLFPCLALVQGLLFLLPLLDRGPNWPETIGMEVQRCREAWWGSLFFLNSWFPFDKMCMVHTWYVSCDLQLFVLASIPVYLLYRWPRVGLACCVLLVLLSVAIVGAVTYILHLYPTIMFLSPDTDEMNAVGSHVYLRPYSHLATYAIGIIVGYIVLKKRNIKINLFLNLLGWIISLSLLMIVLVSCFNWHNGYNAERHMAAIYAALHRAAWGLGLAWITISCVTGHGGFVNTILSWRVFEPLSRLTYLMFLIHMVGIWQRNASRRERFYLRHYDVIYEFFGNLVVAIVLAAVLHLVVEAPFANLDKLLFPNKKVSNPSTVKETQKSGHYRNNNVNGDVIKHVKPFIGEVKVTGNTNSSSRL